MSHLEVLHINKSTACVFVFGCQKKPQRMTNELFQGGLRSGKNVLKICTPGGHVGREREKTSYSVLFWTSVVHANVLFWVWSCDAVVHR